MSDSAVARVASSQQQQQHKADAIVVGRQSLQLPAVRFLFGVRCVVCLVFVILIVIEYFASRV